jgi:hypothetical protein
VQQPKKINHHWLVESISRVEKVVTPSINQMDKLFDSPENFSDQIGLRLSMCGAGKTRTGYRFRFRDAKFKLMGWRCVFLSSDKNHLSERQRTN